MNKNVKDEIEYANQICNPVNRNCHRTTKSKRDHPKLKASKKPLGKTKFQDELLVGTLPFEQDHSVSLSDFRLAWKEEIHRQDLEKLMPKLLEGYLDSKEQLRRIACRAMQDIIQHAKSYAILDAIPHCILPIKTIMSSGNEECIFIMLRTLELWIILVEGAAEVLALFAHQIFSHIRQLLEKEPSSEECAKYGTWTNTSLKDFGFKVMNLLEENAGDRVEDAFHNLKLAVPTYQSPVFTGVRTTLGQAFNHP